LTVKKERSKIQWYKGKKWEHFAEECRNNRHCGARYHDEAYIAQDDGTDSDKV